MDRTLPWVRQDDEDRALFRCNKGSRGCVRCHRHPAPSAGRTSAAPALYRAAGRHPAALQPGVWPPCSFPGTTLTLRSLRLVLPSNRLAEAAFSQVNFLMPKGCCLDHRMSCFAIQTAEGARAARSGQIFQSHGRQLLCSPCAAASLRPACRASWCTPGLQDTKLLTHTQLKQAPALHAKKVPRLARAVPPKHPQYKLDCSSAKGHSRWNHIQWYTLQF